MSPRHRIAVVGSCLWLLGACAVSTQGDAIAVADTDVPFALLEAEDTTTDSSDRVGVVSAPVYLARDDLLVRSERPLSDRRATTVLTSLAAPLTETETAAGLRSLLITDGGNPLAAVGGGSEIVTVDLSESFAELDANSQLLAIGQVVLSLTSQPGVEGVAFTLVGAATEVPRSDGTPSADAVSRTDYISLIGA
jgi:hypothetical protein